MKSNCVSDGNEWMFCWRGNNSGKLGLSYYFEKGFEVKNFFLFDGVFI